MKQIHWIFQLRGRMKEGIWAGLLAPQSSYPLGSLIQGCGSGWTLPGSDRQEKIRFGFGSALRKTTRIRLLSYFNLMKFIFFSFHSVKKSIKLIYRYTVPYLWSTNTKGKVHIEGFQILMLRPDPDPSIFWIPNPDPDLTIFQNPDSNPDLTLF